MTQQAKCVSSCWVSALIKKRSEVDVKLPKVYEGYFRLIRYQKHPEGRGGGGRINFEVVDN